MTTRRSDSGRSGHNLAQGLLSALCALYVAGCVQGGPPRPLDAGEACAEGGPALRINELCADNGGNWIDADGQTGDWVELVNGGDGPLSLADYALGDHDVRPVPLPAQTLAPGERAVFFLDDEPARGADHLPMKLDADGDGLLLWAGDCVADRAAWETLGENVVLARHPDASGALAQCRYASPAADNGGACGPAPRTEPEVARYAAYAFDGPVHAATGPLALNELMLQDGGFVEVLHSGETPIDPADVAVDIAPHRPGLPWPAPGEGVRLAWPDSAALAPGARAVLPVVLADLTALQADPAFEGAVTLSQRSTGEVWDRVDFMRWPAGAVLSRQPDGDGPLRYCSGETRGADNGSCAAVAAREVGDRLRHLRAQADFAQLAAGDIRVGLQAVKVIVDMDAGDVVHFPAAARFPLHYQFVRELIDLDPPLDRCDPDDAATFQSGWWDFTRAQYYATDTRRYLLGTLVDHGPTGLHTLEFTPADAIDGDQIVRAFFAVVKHLPEPGRWAYRPQGARQQMLAEEIEGRLPIVGTDAPFAGVTYQPLSQTTGYGTLRILPAAELSQATLGPRTVVVTDDVPNDIPLVGGLITSAFQTPLAHVNVLSQNRDTPNMALRGALTDPRITAHEGTLVRLEVGGAGFSLTPVEAAEAEAFWAARRPDGPPQVPALDLSERAIVDLTTRGIEASPVTGVKAAQLGELYRVGLSDRQPTSSCPAPATLPMAALAVPVVHSVEHLRDSGGLVLLESLWADEGSEDGEDGADAEAGGASARADTLGAVREAILTHPVAPPLLRELRDAIATNFGGLRVRLRSSSNAEDLPGFNGAGLYSSVSAELDDPDRSVEDGLRAVWASLWSERAYAERQLSRIDHAGVAMGVLVHEAFRTERANGVGVSRNVLDPVRSDMMYLNTQAGEASVTNPAPGVQTQELVWQRPPRTPELGYLSYSSLTGGAPVLGVDEVRSVTCALSAIHTHFRALLDPEADDRLFAMEIEFKFVDARRRFVIKQARPHPFDAAMVPADCREL